MHELVAIQKHEVVHLKDKFDADTPDIDWLKALGTEADWIIISGDPRISRNPIEKVAWLESNLTAFFFSPPFQTSGFWKQAAEMVRWWPAIVEQARKTPVRCGFRLQMNGKKPEQIYPAP